MALVIGLIFMALGCMVFGIGLACSTQNVKEAKRVFWMINIWLLAFMPVSFVYNVLFTGSNAPYPLLAPLVRYALKDLRNPLYMFPAFGLVFIAVCLGVVFFQVKKSRKG